MKEYPEHHKQSKILDKSQAIGEFLDWLCHETDIVFGIWDEHDDELNPYHISIQQILADYFDIDLNKLEAEKQSMLEKIRME